jgi:hypothetical protein
MKSMKNIRSNIAITLTAALSSGYCAGIARADLNYRKNFVGPSLSIGNGQSILGIEGRINIMDKIAVRPSYSFANLAGAGVTVFGGSATYDLSSDNSQLTPFVGLGMNFYTVNVGGVTGTSNTGFAQAGVDINLDRGIALTGDIKVPFNASSPLGTVFSVGGGYRF